MFDGVSPVESEPIGVVSSGWLWAARCSALIWTIALGAGFVAEAAAHDPVSALLSIGPWGSLSLALLYLLFRRGKDSLAFALGVGAAMAFIALLAVARGGLAGASEVLRHLFFTLGMLILVLPPFALATGQSTLAALLGWIFSISSAVLEVKQYWRIPEDGARSKWDGKTAICLLRGSILPACRFADIHAAWLVLFQLQHVNFPCPAPGS
jgi:hypothetical protein